MPNCIHQESFTLVRMNHLSPQDATLCNIAKYLTFPSDLEIKFFLHIFVS